MKEYSQLLTQLNNEIWDFAELKFCEMCIRDRSGGVGCAGFPAFCRCRRCMRIFMWWIGFGRIFSRKILPGPWNGMPGRM